MPNKSATRSIPVLLPLALSTVLATNAFSAAESPAATAPASPTRTQDNVEFTIGPTYANAPELTVNEGVPKGTIHEFTMNSEDSKIYPGIAKGQTGTVPYKRKVLVYVPQQYVAGTPAPFIVAQDGLGYANTLPKVLDNMIHEKRLPVMIAIMINSGGGDAQGSQRGLEYDTVSDKYTGFIETEVLPRITKDYNVKFTADPEGRATMGGSSGAACAFTMAWFRPDLYRRVLSYSGTFVNQQSPANPESPHGAWEYHEHFIPQTDRKPIRVWLEVSENDNGSKRDEGSLHNWVMANQRMAAALKAKGYPYRYVFAEAAGHTDGRVTRQTLPGALEWLWQGDAVAGKSAKRAPQPDSPPPASGKRVQLFDGASFTGWEGDTQHTWRVEKGALVGGTLAETVPHNDFLCTTRQFKNFDLRLKVKLDGTGFVNGGVQFRSQRLKQPAFEMTGYQADMGAGYWASLYDESRRNRTLAHPDTAVLQRILKPNDWNDYIVRCENSHIRLWLNGVLTVDYTEDNSDIPLTGLIGFQIHGGGKAEASYKDITIEELP